MLQPGRVGNSPRGQAARLYEQLNPTGLLVASPAPLGWGQCCGGVLNLDMNQTEIDGLVQVRLSVMKNSSKIRYLNNT